MVLDCSERSARCYRVCLQKGMWKTHSVKGNLACDLRSFDLSMIEEDVA